jgi:hypothetical protein
MAKATAVVTTTIELNRGERDALIALLNASDNDKRKMGLTPEQVTLTGRLYNAMRAVED